LYSGVLYEVSLIHGPMPCEISELTSALNDAIRVRDVGSSWAARLRGAFQTLSAENSRGTSPLAEALELAIIEAKNAAKVAREQRIVRMV